MPDILLRAFPAAFELSGQRQLTGRLVPYDTPTEVLDRNPDGTPDRYFEGFRRGAFAPQSGSTEKGVFRRIGLIHKHEGGLGFLGPFTALREEADGLYGDAAILRSRANDVEDLLANGVEELSVEFRLPGRANTEVVDGVRWRVRAHLDAVALEPKGAYSDARVLAFRDEMDEIEREAADEQAAEAAEAARVEAEAQRLLDEEAAARAKVDADRAAEAEVVAQRAARFAELSERLTREQARQTLYVTQYGLTVPPHNGLPIHGY
jgi:HK97 family phage prohead protease